MKTRFQILWNNRIEMAAEQAIQDGSLSITHPACMESINRISKFPVIESTIETATSIYGKVKDYNSVTNWTLSTAESTVNMAVEVGKPIATPVIKNLEGPIKKVDNVLCTGLDYVESKVPAVKKRPSEMYTTTKDFFNSTVTPAMETTRAYAEPAVKTAKDIMGPTFERAKTAMEPTVERAKHLVEPYVQPALDKANAIKDNVMHKVDEYLHRGHKHEGDALECEECQEVRRKMEESNSEPEQDRQ
ncbi:hypothetical protein JTB14_001602 [Gonioctena quinquepunctata]|nr:hypothetical protein JTB14_001602 [Gonioctena quinquepunctata]